MGKIRFNTSNFEFLKSSGILHTGEEEIETSELVVRTFNQDTLAQVSRAIAAEVDALIGLLAIADDNLDKAKVTAEKIVNRATLRTALDKLKIAQSQIGDLTKQTVAIAECLDGIKAELAKNPRKGYGRYSEMVKAYLSTIEEFTPQLILDANIKIGLVKAIRTIILNRKNDLLL